MTEARWKLVMDGQSLTIANDRFQFTTNGPGPAVDLLSADDSMFEAVESSQIEGIVSELQTMTKRTYGQYCGLARALEIVGERWVMLLIRNLLVSPKSGLELQRGLPRIPMELLCSRLSELERVGVVKRGLPGPDGTVAFELTEWGRELDDIVLRLGRWGTRLLGDPRPEDIVTADGVVTALRATFQPAAALDFYAGYELRLGDIVVHACVTDGTVDVAVGELPDADLVIEPGPYLKGLITGELDPYEAVSGGRVSVIGDPALLQRFVEVFYLASA
jgi:DNA-binding HxlR family transcriptional regulator